MLRRRPAKSCNAFGSRTAVFPFKQVVSRYKFGDTCRVRTENGCAAAHRLDDCPWQSLLQARLNVNVGIVYHLKNLVFAERSQKLHTVGHSAKLCNRL